MIQLLSELFVVLNVLFERQKLKVFIQNALSCKLQYADVFILVKLYLNITSRESLCVFLFNLVCPDGTLAPNPYNCCTWALHYEVYGWVVTGLYAVDLLKSHEYILFKSIM